MDGGRSLDEEEREMDSGSRDLAGLTKTGA